MSKIGIASCLLAGLGAVALLLAGGCQASPPSTATSEVVATADQPQVATCDKCRMIWVKRSTKTHKGMLVYRRKKAMRCSDCDTAAANFFKPGKAQPICKSCGGTTPVC